MSIILHSIIILAPEKSKIGIVLTGGAEDDVGSIAMEGVEKYSRYFDLTILDYELDTSNFSTSYEYPYHLGTEIISALLTKDFNNPEITRQIRSQYDIDMVVFVTNHPVANWVDNPYVSWGEADTESMSCVFSVYGYEDGSEYSNEHIRFIALHEVGHLLGYGHEKEEFDCVMRYAGFNSEFCEKHALELPYRNYLWRMGDGMYFSNAVLIIQFSIALTFLPVMISLAIGIHWAFDKSKYQIKPNIYVINAGICASMFLLMISEYIIWTVLPAILFGIIFQVILMVIWAAFLHIKKKPE